jgi:DNA-binding transcriptional LysR family regulator
MAGQAGRKEGQKAVDLRKFLTTLVEVHQEGGTLKMVADQLGVTPAAVSSRIKTLRDKGVSNLPEFERARGVNIASEATDILSELGYAGDEDEDNGDDE